MNEVKLVSIIIPVYNCGTYLEKCLNSVKKQSYQCIEIIVVNDGSTDESSDILNGYAQDDDVVVIDQENQGVSAARNRGIECAKGEYLLFLDGDDYIGENYVRTLLEAAEKNKADMVICGCTMVDVEGRVIRRLVPEGYKRDTQEEWAYRLSSVCSHLYRKKAWIESGIKFATGVRGEDLPVALFFNYTCRSIVTLQTAEYYYVQHSDSAMGRAHGLRSFQLPMEAVRDVIDKVRDIEIHNSREFLEYGVLKAFAMFLFDLGRGADWQIIGSLCRKTEDIVFKYFPEYWKNPKYRWKSGIDMPFEVKGAVWLLVRLMQFHVLKPFMWLYCRIT